MKLYATVTSERASKGQGGNKYLNFEITVGEEDEKQTILYGMVERTENEKEDIYVLWNGDLQADKIIIPKGKKQKGEKQCCTIPDLYNTNMGARCNNCGDYKRGKSL